MENKNTSNTELSQSVVILQQTVAVLQSEIKTMSSALVTMGNSLTGLQEKFNTARNINWQVLFAAVALCGSIFYFISENSQKDSKLEVQPVVASMGQVTQSVAQLQQNSALLNDSITRLQSDLSSNTSRDMQSITDRQHLNEQLLALAKDVSDSKSDRKAHEASMLASLVEIETQFRAMAQMSNMRSNSSQQLLGIIYQKVFNQPLPSGVYNIDMSRNKAE